MKSTRLARGGLLLVLLYCPLAVIGLQWARIGGAGSAVWPAFGLSLAALLLGGWRLWPAVFIGRLLASFVVGSVQPLWAEVAIAAANACADGASAYLLLHVFKLDIRIATRRDILLLIGGVFGASAIAATIGTLTLGAAAELAGPRLADLWVGWWFGNVVAGLTVTPLLLSWLSRESPPFGKRQLAHFVFCLATVAAGAYFVFEPEHLPWLRAWHLFPVLIWAALAFYMRGASAALLISSGLAIWGAGFATGPLAVPGLDPILNTQQFIAVTAITVLLLAATSEERRKVEPMARLAAIAGSSADAMVSTDLAGRITSWNKGAEDLFGLTEQEALGQPTSIVAPPPGTIAAEGSQEDIFRRILAGERVDVETARRTKSGALIDVHIVGSQLRTGGGDILGALAVVRDIRARKQAEAALREESEMLELLNRTGAALAGELEHDRIVQMVTDAGREVTGAAFGAFFYNVLDDQGGALLLYTLSGAERSQFEDFGLPRATSVFRPTFVGEGIIRSADITADPRYGHNFPHHGMPAGHLPVRSYLAVPVFSRSGGVIGGLFFGHPEPDVFSERSERILVGLAAQAAIAIDNARLFKEAEEEIAERRRAEAALRELNDTLENRVGDRTSELLQAQDQLRQAQKMEAIGQLTGGVAHDFNNLLTIIRSSADMLRRKQLPEDRRRLYVDAISDTADRAAKLTAQLLAFARRQALKPEVFDAPERARLICDMVRTVVGGRITIALETNCEDCFIEADIAQFETAVINMAVNARDAMDGEGKLTISASAVSEIPANGSARPIAGDHVAIAITDTGRGIAPELLGQIFEPFFTTKEVGKGTGLGLSQVYGFAKQSGGDVRVESRLGEGTTFTLYLPRVAPAVPDTIPEAAGEEEHRHERSCILVVEDNKEVGEFASQLLAELGHETRLASTAAQALRILEQEADRFDLVFTDVVMPGMSGIDLGLEIRQRWPGLRVVLTSGYSHVLAQEGRHGFELLHKPYAVESLVRVLRRPAALARQF